MNPINTARLIRVTFRRPVDQITVRFPWAPPHMLDNEYLVTFEGENETGEPVPATHLEAYFSDILGLPFFYTTVSGAGMATRTVTVGGEGVMQLCLAIVPWSRTARDSPSDPLGLALVTGRCSKSGRSWSTLEEGVVP